MAELAKAGLLPVLYRCVVDVDAKAMPGMVDGYLWQWLALSLLLRPEVVGKAPPMPTTALASAAAHFLDEAERLASAFYEPAKWPLVDAWPASHRDGIMIVSAAHAGPGCPWIGAVRSGHLGVARTQHVYVPDASLGPGSALDTALMGVAAVRQVQARATAHTCIVQL